MIFEGKRYDNLTFYKLKNEKMFILVNTSNVWETDVVNVEIVASLSEDFKLNMQVTDIPLKVLYEMYTYVPPSRVPYSWQQAFKPFIIEHPNKVARKKAGWI